MVAKLSIYLTFALVVLPYYSVLCQDNEWQSLIDQANQYGISQGTVAEAQNVLGESSMEQVAEDALRDGSLADWVIEASEDPNKGSTPPPTETPMDLPSDEENSPMKAPNLAPSFPPNVAPEWAPSPGPYAPSPQA